MSAGVGTSPPWLRDESYEDTRPLNRSGYAPPAEQVINFAQPNAAGPQQGQTHGGVSGALPARPSMIHYALKATTMLLCLLMDITAIVGIEYLNGVDAAEKLFVAAYMLFFATLLFVFEALEFRKVEWLENWFRRNFGFLYSAIGKALFIIFIAFLCFGLGDPETLTLATGIALSMFGALEVGLYLKYPEIFENKDPINR